jgi:hypothetical protein
MRINDAILREAKAEAGREGMPLARFLEEALTFRVRVGRQGKAPASLELPVFDSGKRLPKSFDLAATIRDANAQEDTARVGALMAREISHAKPRKLRRGEGV